jgi:hypothetical protein
MVDDDFIVKGLRFGTAFVRALARTMRPLSFASRSFAIAVPGV